ncbi:MAG: pentapeptide repeat-containing protein [Methyloglobulus sp.]
MRKLKVIFQAVPLMMCLLGALLFSTSGNVPQMTDSDLVQSPASASLSFNSSSEVTNSLKPLVRNFSHAVENTGKNLVLTKAKENQIHKLPGIFRGDWGETPVYAKNDRVNHEGAAYLSLLDENQNQPPSTSFAFWRLVKKARGRNPEACFSPAPSMDLGECDFTENGSLRDLNLSGANLSKARLNGELGSADLRGANLTGAAVIGSLVISPDTQIDHVNFSGLQSDGNNPLIAESANLTDSNFNQANLYGAKMKGATLDGTTLTGATLTSANLAEASLENANMSKADMAYANLSSGYLANATLGEANLEQADLSHANFSQANIQKANLAGANLAEANFSGADLRGVNLSAAQNAGSAIIDNFTDFMSAVCPDGVTVDGMQVTTCVGHGF